MSTNWRALCVELTDCLEKADWPHRYKVVFQQWTDIARKALAEPEPEGPTDADQELEACCADIQSINGRHRADWLRSMRRPKPPNLKEQSLALIDKIQGNKDPWDIRDLDVVRCALEQLDD